MPTRLQLVQGATPHLGDPIAAVQVILRKYPQARVESSPARVTVYPVDATGFEVSLKIHKSACHVFCEGWHEEFADPESALHCFASALSPASRLRVTRRGGVAYRWELQGRDASGQWVGVSEVGRWLFPFWARKEVVYLQNQLLEAA